ncbi:MAG: DegV family protein [Oscillospiraceae bacterium]|nr:DegV family protein [Oscillospiraceae bacterium]
MIRLYTDTSANLPAELIRKYAVGVIPFSYTVDGEPADYSAETDFDGKKFYGAMRAGADVRTSMVNVSDFLGRFEADVLAGDSVLYVGMSGGISGTANSAAVAVQELRERHPGACVEAIDTFAASLGEGLLVLRAAEMIARGDAFGDVAADISARRHTMCQYFTVDDLEYLKKGGRISGAAALIGNLLGIKPILKGDEAGRIVLCGKTRGSERALAHLAEKYASLAEDRTARIGIAHADNEAGAASLLASLKKCGFAGECVTVFYEPVTGGHVGPGTVALFFPGTEK